MSGKSDRIMSRFHRGNDIDHTTRRKYSKWKQNIQKMKTLLKSFRQDDITSLTMDTVRTLFDELDANHDGKIDIDEIQAYFRKMGTELDADTAASLMDEADSDHSGEIDITEFKGASVCISFASVSCSRLHVSAHAAKAANHGPTGEQAS